MLEHDPILTWRDARKFPQTAEQAAIGANGKKSEEEATATTVIDGVAVTEVGVKAEVADGLPENSVL
jgi:hypothetical protein